MWESCWRTHLTPAEYAEFNFTIVLNTHLSMKTPKSKRPEKRKQQIEWCVMSPFKSADMKLTENPCCRFACYTMKFGHCVISLTNLHPFPPIWVSSPGVTHRIAGICRCQTSQCSLFYWLPLVDSLRIMHERLRDNLSREKCSVSPKYSKFVLWHVCLLCVYTCLSRTRQGRAFFMYCVMSQWPTTTVSWFPTAPLLLTVDGATCVRAPPPPLTPPYSD